MSLLRALPTQRVISRVVSARIACTGSRVPACSRGISFKLFGPRFASASVTTTVKTPPPDPLLGPFPYTAPPSESPSEQDKTSSGATSQIPSQENLPQISFDERKVAVGWDASTWSRFHNIWLRDHCRCEECFHPITKQRLFDTFEIAPDLQPSRVAATDAGLEVIWHGLKEHKSVYPWTWLHQHSYDPPISSVAASMPQQEKVLWGSRIQQDPPTVQFQDVMVDERAVLKWVEKIDRFGFCFVSGVPANPEDTERLARRIGVIRETQYGGFWDFTADLKLGDTAYTNLALKAHTDTTYFTDPCGLQLFHLLSHTEGTGGSTLLVDGFYVASLLSTLHPEVHKILSQVPVPAHSAGTSSASPSSLSYLYHPSPSVGYPILRHNERTGELIQVRYNNDDRSVIRHLEPAMVEPWYNALRTWNKALTSADSEYWVQLAPGTAVVIDNQRVLHGRSAFTGKRRMCGAYIGLDDYRSRLNVLRVKFAPAPPSSQNHAGPGSVWDPAF